MPDDFRRAAFDFKPPPGFNSEFDRLSAAIGPAAYLTWFRGVNAWVKEDGEIVLDCPTPLRARRIREHYAATLADITGRFIIVTGDQPMSVGSPTHEAWWQTHDARIGTVVAERRDPAAERVEIQRRLDAGESVGSMMVPVLGVRVVVESDTP